MGFIQTINPMRLHFLLPWQDKELLVEDHSVFPPWIYTGPLKGILVQGDQEESFKLLEPGRNQEASEACE